MAVTRRAAPPGPMRGVNRIAVLRAGGLGDLVFGLPALEALRATYPDAEIVLLARPWAADLFEGRPSPLDRVVAVPPGMGVVDAPDGADAAEVEEGLDGFFARMAVEGFDLAVQLHGGGRHSNQFTLRLRARTTIGMSTPDAVSLDREIPYVYWQSEVMRCLEVVALAGARTTEFEPRLAVTRSDRAEGAALLPQAAGPLVAIHPGAGDGRRRWPVERFAAVADAVAAAGARVVLVGSEADRELVQGVAEATSAAVINTCGRLALGGLAGLFARCALVVGNDSGPIHLAGAVGARTVAVYWCGNAITAGTPARSRHRPVLSWRLNCPVCDANCIEHRCEHRESFVADVPAEAVLEPALELLGEAQRDVAAPTGPPPAQVDRLRPRAYAGPDA